MSTRSKFHTDLSLELYSDIISCYSFDAYDLWYVVLGVRVSNTTSLHLLWLLNTPHFVSTGYKSLSSIVDRYQIQSKVCLNGR